MVAAMVTPARIDTADFALLKEQFLYDCHETWIYQEERDALTRAGISSCKEIHDSKPLPKNNLYSRKWQYRGLGASGSGKT